MLRESQMVQEKHLVNQIRSHEFLSDSQKRLSHFMMSKEDAQDIRSVGDS